MGENKVFGCPINHICDGSDQIQNEGGMSLAIVSAQLYLPHCNGMGVYVEHLSAPDGYVILRIPYYGTSIKNRKC